MNFSVGEKAFYYKVINDKSSIELVDIIHIDQETKSLTIYIPSLKRERDTELSRLMKRQIISYSNAKIEYKLPKRKDPYYPQIYSGTRKQIHTKSFKECLFGNKTCYTQILLTSDVADIGFKSDSGVTDSTRDQINISDIGLIRGVKELYTEVGTLYESIDVLYKNQLILDKKITSIKNELVEELKSLKVSLAAQTEINKSVELKLKELQDIVNPPVMIKPKKSS